MDKKKEIKCHKDAIKAASAIYRFPLVDVQGIPLMNSIAKNWSAVQAFRPDPSDVLISTYPKAGTTWTQEIVDLLLHNGDAEICRRAPIVLRIPFLELNSPPPIPAGLDLLKSVQPPRFMKTHLPIQLVPEGFWKNKCKIIYVARNAKDNLVSYFHFDQMDLTQPEPGPWDEYVQKFMKGKSWYDHVKGYWKEKEKRNILYLFYEDMKENPIIVKIMQYLDLSRSDDIIDKIVELTSFNVMKDNPMANYSFVPKAVFDQSISKFLRKGEVGDWINYFTPAQSQIFDEDYARQMADVDIPFHTKI
ncbi:Sulfotransferase 1 family member D1 [Bagarius yarrelli]|uniref:Sulfotransferase n=1 Tax=Bagarius yarrelli TaxID=175774 RepID=A0A556U0Y7_BAGYA|nr:Sulfotransferase 1 family member D1 [Bagarius yarrelli]